MKNVFSAYQKEPRNHFDSISLSLSLSLSNLYPVIRWHSPPYMSPSPSILPYSFSLSTGFWLFNGDLIDFLSLSLYSFPCILSLKMAVELMGFPKMEEQKAIQEAASEGLRGMEHLIRVLSHQPNQLDCTDLTDVTVSKFKKVISLLNRSGHARFRRAPVQPSPFSSSPSSSTSPPQSSNIPSSKSLSRSQTLNLTPAQFTPQATVSPAPIVNPVTLNHTPINTPSSFVPSQSQSLTLDFTKPNILSTSTKSMELEFSKETFSVSSNSSFMSSAITGDGSVSNGKQGSSIFLTPAVPTASGGKPPLSGPPFKKQRCHDHREHSDDVSGSSKCHCIKRR